MLSVERRRKYIYRGKKKIIILVKDFLSWRATKNILLLVFNHFYSDFIAPSLLFGYQLPTVRPVIGSERSTPLGGKKGKRKIAKYFIFSDLPSMFEYYFWRQ